MPSRVIFASTRKKLYSFRGAKQRNQKITLAINLLEDVKSRKLSPFEYNKLVKPASLLQLTKADARDPTLQSLVSKLRTAKIELMRNRGYEQELRRMIRVQHRIGLQTTKGPLDERLLHDFAPRIPFVEKSVLGQRKRQNKKWQTEMRRRFWDSQKRVQLPGFSGRIYYMPDYSKIAREYFILQHAKAGPVLFIKEERRPVTERYYSIAEQAGTLGVTFRELIKAKLEGDRKKGIKRDVNYLKRLIQRERGFKVSLENSILRAQAALANNKLGQVNVRELIERLSDYGALYLDAICPVKYFEQKIAGLYPELPKGQRAAKAAAVVSQLLTVPSGRSWLTDVYIGTAKMAKLKLEGRKPDYKYFAEKFGFLEASDLLPVNETREQVDRTIDEFIRKKMEGGKNREEAWLDIERTLESIKYAKHFAKYRRIQTERDIIARARRLKRNPKLFSEIAHFCGLTSEFNEDYRSYRTTVFRISRESLNYFKLDLQTTSLDELEGITRRFAERRKFFKEK